MTIETWLAFAFVFFFLGLPVGPNAIAVMAAGSRQGIRAGATVAAGIAAAGLIHALIACLGFGALFLVSAKAFTVVKFLGAGYLLWLAIRLWRSSGTVQPGEAAKAGPARHFLTGFLISMTNPKAVISYVASFTPFIATDQALVPQLVILIPTSTVIVLIIYLTWAGLAQPLGHWLTTASRKRLLNRIFGSFLAFAAMGLVFSERK